MFQKPKYLQNSFNLVFDRKQSIRKNSFEFEKELEDLYTQPEIINIPDDINPDMPRIVFNSKHGHSQIIISQLSFILNVNYSSDWQYDISKGEEYILSKVSMLYKLLEIVGEKCPSFCGFSTLVQIPAQEEDDKSVISHIYDLFSKDVNPDSSDIYEFQIKTSKVVEQEFFSNITVQNYRSWNIDIVEGIIKLSHKEINESGIQIVGDFNNRYAFNERDGYCSIESQAKKIIDLGLSDIKHTIEKIIGGQ